jgi:hypothetical protein
MQQTIPACPLCENPNPYPIRSTPQFESSRHLHPYATIRAFKCKCGITFSQTTLHRPQ